MDNMANPTLTPSSRRMKHIIRNSETGIRFPKLDECAHFHYDTMDLGPVNMTLVDGVKGHTAEDKENASSWFNVQITSQGRSWTLRRSYENFRLLDQQLHRCIYDRNFSHLPELPGVEQLPEDASESEVVIRNVLTEYLQRFSCLVGNLLSCGSVLNWLELDNRGNRILITDESAAINTPAVAAACVIKRYVAQAADEISFEKVGEMISIIDMPPADESTWWRGKKGFEVGFFPSECVQVIGDKLPHNLKIPTKPVLRRHGKLIAFFRSFLLSRPSRRKLKQSGILKERVFGCDLCEHLTNTGRDVPLVLSACAKFIEQYGIVDGIYRLSGVTSNIQKLRVTFDEDRVPNMNEQEIVQDIHCVASLLKMYFRELPNPLLTYQLYDKFVAAMQLEGNNRLLKVREVVKELPPPHYRTLEFLMRHLANVSAHGAQTGMTAKNVAIVWAPNLLRSKDLEGASVGALHVIGVQAVLTEYLICYVDLIFNEKMPAYPSPESLESTPKRNRPKSLAISTPAKLLSLEEARNRVLTANLPTSQQKYIDVGGGPDSLPEKYHTVIELPHGKRGSAKLKKSPSGWKQFFARGWHSGSTRGKDKRSQNVRKTSTSSLPHHSLPSQENAVTEADLLQSHSKQLRSVKSAESLVSSNGHSCRNSEALDSCSPADGLRSWTAETSPLLGNSPAAENSTNTGSSQTASPGVHKHVRSVSHDSYFEKGLDLSLDDIHMVFDMVQQHHMQQSSISQAPSMQKSPRKQKSMSDSEAGSPKVQRLSDHSLLIPYESSQSGEAPEYFQDGLQESIEALTSTLSASEQQNVDPQNRENHSLFETEVPKLLSLSKPKQSGTPYTSRQPLAVHSPDDIEPYKSPSPPDQIPSCKQVIVERYGSEKTVLVEVHATQESSDEESNIFYSQQFPDCENIPVLSPGTEVDILGTDKRLRESDVKHAESQIDNSSDQSALCDVNFLNKLSDTLPYIEDTDTASASPVSPMCEGLNDHNVPKGGSTADHKGSTTEVDSSSTASIGGSPAVVYGSTLTKETSEPVQTDRGDIPSTVILTDIDLSLPLQDECVDRDMFLYSTHDDNTLKEHISLLPEKSPGLEMVSPLSDTSSQHIFEDSEPDLYEHKRVHTEPSSSDEEETVPYLNLVESPMVETLKPFDVGMVHSSSQNVCLISPVSEGDDQADEEFASEEEAMEQKDETSRDVQSNPLDQSTCYTNMQIESWNETNKNISQENDHNIEYESVSRTEEVSDNLFDEEISLLSPDWKDDTKEVELDSTDKSSSFHQSTLNSSLLSDHKDGNADKRKSLNLHETGIPFKRLSSVEESRRKFESDVGRSILHDSQMRSEIEKIQAQQISPDSKAKSEDRKEAKTKSQIPSKSTKKTSSTKSASVQESKGSADTKSRTLKTSESESLDSNMDSSLEIEGVQLRSGSSKIATLTELKRKSEPQNSLSGKENEKKRLSEPVFSSTPRPAGPERKASVKELMSKFETSESTPESSSKSLKNSQPSLYTQMKVLRLQSLQNPSPVESSSFDPWSDPILDREEEEQKGSFVDLHEKDMTDSQEDGSEKENKQPCHTTVADESTNKKSKEEHTKSYEAERPSSLNLNNVHTPREDKVRSNQDQSSSISSPTSDSKSGGESDEVRRKRIEKYKEERRAQLRERLKSESFRTSSEEKDRTSDPKPKKSPEDDHHQKRSPKKWNKQSDSSGKVKNDGTITDKPPTSGSKKISPSSPVKGSGLKDSDNSNAKSKELIRREDSSPPKRIRDRAAMFECRGRDSHPPRRLSRTSADMPSC